MDERSHKDKMEQFFGKNWDDKQLSNEMGVPDLEDSWDFIQDKVQKDRRRFPFWIWLIPGVLIAVAVMFFIPSGKNQIVREVSSHSVTQTMDPSENVTESKPLLSNEKKTEVLSSQEATASENSNLKLEESRQSNSQGVQGSEEEKQNDRSSSVTTDVDASSNAPMTKQLKAGRSEFATQNLTTVSGKDNIDPAQRREVIPSQPIDRSGWITSSLSSLISGLAIPTSTLSQQGFIETDIKQLESRSWSLEAGLGYGRHAFIFSNDETSLGPVSIQFEEGEMIQAELRAYVDYNDIHKAIVGVGWRQHSFTSHYELGVNYTGQGEILDGQGFYHQGYQHTLPTIFGDIPMEHVLIRSQNETLQEGEYIPFALYLQHRIQELNVTIGHQLSIPQQKWNYILGGRLTGGLWIENQGIEQLRLTSHHSQVHHNKTEFDRQAFSIDQAWHLSAAIEFGLTRQLWENQKVGVRAQFSQPLIAPALHAGVNYNPQMIGLVVSWEMQF